MKISVLTIWNGETPHVGYGEAARHMIKSLEILGHSVSYADPTAPVEIAFMTPDQWQWSNPEAYHIGYLPWESTRLPDAWPDLMRAADEIWTTSPWVAGVFDKHGIANVRVYEHGVDAFVWERYRRLPKDAIRFLHIGEPAFRKAGQLVFDTFVETFGDRSDVSLTIKAYEHHAINGLDRFDIEGDGSVVLNERDLPDNVTVITEDLPEWGLKNLLHAHHVLVYPSWGEGFGLIPLQAMVTGMPVICTEAWASYADLLPPDLRLPSHLVPSPWPDKHPGNMHQPDATALRNTMVKLADRWNYADASVRAYQKSFLVEQRYDWLKLTESAWAHIVRKFE